MSEPERYWTQPFIDILEKELNRDPGFQKAARKFQGRVALRCLDTPEGKDVEGIYEIDRGRVTIHAEFDDAPSSAIRNRPFDKSRLFARTTAPYDLWVRLDKGEMNVVQAIAHPQYKVEGPKIKIMTNIGVFNTMGDVASRLPKRY